MKLVNILRLSLIAVFVAAGLGCGGKPAKQPWGKGYTEPPKDYDDLIELSEKYLESRDDLDYQSIVILLTELNPNYNSAVSFKDTRGGNWNIAAKDKEKNPRTGKNEEYRYWGIWKNVREQFVGPHVPVQNKIALAEAISKGGLPVFSLDKKNWMWSPDWELGRTVVGESRENFLGKKLADPGVPLVPGGNRYIGDAELSRLVFSEISFVWLTYHTWGLRFIEPGVRRFEQLERGEF
ncbi:MAG: hypothetical protein JSU72_03020 [Deltaproteobacteria bacterium]|nr:MAG: hypothetical protein JSU72_03020 [Deltaproteobacteria bacterium]